MATVRAAVLTASGARVPYAESRPIEVRELSLLGPGPRELRIAVRAAGLCHSDLSVIDGLRPRDLPLALGHEAAGEVLEVGPGVTAFAPGDHVILAFVPVCGDCGQCRGGRPSLCEPGAAANAAGTLLGGGRRWEQPGGEVINHHLGVSAFAEQIVVSERSAVKVDRDLPFDVAALFGCAVLTGVGAALNATDISPGESVGVFGLGGVGLAGLMGAVYAGAEVIAIDRVAEKLELGRELGATHVLEASDDVAEAIRDMTRGGVAHAFETVGSAAVVEQAYAATRAGGTTVTVGLPHPSEQLTIPAVSLVTGERTLKGSYLGSCAPARDIPRFVELYRAGRLPVQRLITHRLTLDDLNGGFDRLARGEAVRQVLVL